MVPKHWLGAILKSLLVKKTAASVAKRCGSSSAVTVAFCRWKMLRWCDHHEVGLTSSGLAKNKRLKPAPRASLQDSRAAACFCRPPDIKCAGFTDFPIRCPQLGWCASRDRQDRALAARCQSALCGDQTLKAMPSSCTTSFTVPAVTWKIRIKEKPNWIMFRRSHLLSSTGGRNQFPVPVDSPRWPTP